jgi:site-specific DNA recombinase
MKAAIYARFSSNKQTDRSIDDQVALCRQICAREGLIVTAVYDDRAISGASMVNRLGLQRLLRDARAGQFAVVVTEDLDRISRNQSDMARIHERLQFAGVALRTARDGITEDIHIGVKGLLGPLYLKDLAQKTRRGQAGVVKDGRHNGGRSFGYRAIVGRKGELEIDAAEAGIVRRIFASYLDGRSARDIAADLNAERIGGPRGGIWNASTIAGSRKRENGILQNSLYVGRIVWNRQTFIKDPDTGKRVSRKNPRAQWMSAEAPHLRIVDQSIWDKVQARRDLRGGPQLRRLATRPQHLLSGLVKCGACGSGYITTGIIKSGPRLVCSRMRETGLCDNKVSIARGALEDRVITGIEKHLAAPELIAAYVREFHNAMRELNAAAGGRRRALESRLTTVAAAIGKAVDALLGQEPSRALRDRLAELESERDAIEGEIAQLAPPAIEMHPKAGEVYRDKVRDLKAALQAADPDHRAQAIGHIRELVEKIVIHPRGKKQPVDIEIHGQLAALLKISEQGAVPQKSV